MQRDELIAYCLAKPGAEETYPWGEEELVAKVGGKGFAFIGDGTVGVKCGRDAAEAAEWRNRYPGGNHDEPLRRALRLELRRLDRPRAGRRGARADRRLVRRGGCGPAEEPPSARLTHSERRASSRVFARLAPTVIVSVARMNSSDVAIPISGSGMAPR